MNWNDIYQTMNSAYPHKWRNKSKADITFYFTVCTLPVF